VFRQGSFLDRLQKSLTQREERSAIPPPGLAAYQYYGMPADFKAEESLKAYGDNVYLYRSVLTIAMEIARTTFRLQRERSDGSIEFDDNHQALEVLNLPQPTKEGKTLLTHMDLMLILGMRLMLNGEDFWVLDKRRSARFGGSPQEINPALPQYMNIVFGRDGDIQEYVYRLPEKEQRFAPIDVVHFKLPNPLNIYRGQSPVEPIRFAHDSYGRADATNVRRFKNNSVPDGVITTETALTPEQIQAYREQWRQMYGSENRSSNVAVMPKGMDFKAVQQTNQESQFIEGKTLNRDDILAAYGVDNQTRANAEASIFIFERFGVLPFLEKIRDTLTSDYLPAFAGSDELSFTFDDPVPQNMEEKRANMQTGFSLGAVTPNEVRKQLGLEPLNLPGMDVPYLDLNKMPVGESPPLTLPQTNP
jgi:HK97 family phage portal protein